MTRRDAALIVRQFRLTDRGLIVRSLRADLSLVRWDPTTDITLA
jgi:hypothetical protein